VTDTPSSRTPPPSPGGDGVRVIPKARTVDRSVLAWLVFVVIAIGALVAWRLLMQKPVPPASTDPVPVSVSATGSDATPDAAAIQAAGATPQAVASLPTQTSEHPNGDPNDLANYFQPGDPEPTGAEVIGALHDVGIRTGIGAFNPPGTSPPLEGLAVSPSFDLPPGYVRHHQSSDEGVPIEPILMYAPDFQAFDANGRPLAMPANRVVPPERAPPGLPVRWVHIPRP